MPRKDIWIRVGDLDKWEAIEDKPLFLHTVLNEREELMDVPTRQNKLIKEHVKNMTSIKATSENLCKIHGTPLTDYNKCLQKGCKHN